MVSCKDLMDYNEKNGLLYTAYELLMTFKEKM